jgi:hypothetical protein
MADKALAAFVIIQAALKRSQRLFAYSQREDLNKRMPGFQVNRSIHGKAIITIQEERGNDLHKHAPSCLQEEEGT